MSSPYLLPEILDYIADLLHDELETLKRCCLVAKSWVPRTRKHLFADIEFQTEEHLRSWKQGFPDPSTSPACYAKTLLVGCSQVDVAADAEADGWIRGFSRVVRLVVHAYEPFSPIPFHGFSPVPKSLHLDAPALPPSRLINLILSFPLLEDLAVVAFYEASVDDDDGSDRPLTAVQPSSTPTFTGTLELYIKGGMESVARQLLSLPGGIHFRALVLWRFQEADLLTTMALVEGCSHTLECLGISDHRGASIQHMRPHR